MADEEHIEALVFEPVSGSEELAGSFQVNLKV